MSVTPKRRFHLLDRSSRSPETATREFQIAVCREARIAAHEACDEEKLWVEVLPTDKVPTYGEYAVLGPDPNRIHVCFCPRITQARKMAAQRGGSVWIEVRFEPQVTVTVTARLPKWLTKKAAP